MFHFLVRDRRELKIVFFLTFQNKISGEGNRQLCDFVDFESLNFLSLVINFALHFIQPLTSHSFFE